MTGAVLGMSQKALRRQGAWLRACVGLEVARGVELLKFQGALNLENSHGIHTPVL